jgi:hypothetical protein
MSGKGKVKMPGAWDYHETHAVPSSAASSSATENQHSDQRRTTQHENAHASLHNFAALESTPAIDGEVAQSPGVHRLKQRFKLMSIALDGSSGGDEEDEEDEEDDEEEDRNENEPTVPTPDPNDATSGSGQVETRSLSFDDALTIVTEMEDFVVEDDDVAKVSAEPEKWISALMKAFVTPHSDKPTFSDFSGIAQEEFTSWQEAHVKKTETRLSSILKLREALAVVLFNMVIQLHEGGRALVCPGNSKSDLDKKLSCSMRLKLMVAATEKLPIVRWDVSTRQRLLDLIHSPISAAKTKEAKKRDNEVKKEKYKHLRKADGKPGQSSSTRKGSHAAIAMADARKLLECCTSLAGVDCDTGMEDASGLETAGA